MLAHHILAWRGTNVYGDLVKLLAFMDWVHFFFHNNYSLLITDSKVELQKNLKWSYIYLCLASHHYLLYFVRWVHWCQVWAISAEQLFITVNRELMSCLGRKNRASQLNPGHSDQQESFPGDGNHDVHKMTHSAKSERFGLYGCSIFLHVFNILPQLIIICLLPWVIHRSQQYSFVCWPQVIYC